MVFGPKDEPTIELAQHVADLLEQMDERGRVTLQRLIAEVADWNDLRHLKPDKRAQARISQGELKKAIREYARGPVKIYSAQVHREPFDSWMREL